MISSHTKMQNWGLKVENTDRVSDQSRTDHYDWKAHYMAEDIARRAAKMQTNALDIDVRLFNLYTRMVNGRRCSCFRGVSQEPKGDCPICFGQGIVGGFEKFGTRLEVVDPSRLCTCVNVFPDVANINLPPMFRLNDDSLSGFVICDVDIGYNIGEVDYFNCYSGLTSNLSHVVAYVKPYGTQDTSYVEVKDYKQIETLLASGIRKITFKITLSRNHLEVVSPCFSHLYLRYRTRSKQQGILKGDIPPVQNSSLFDPNGGSQNSFTSLSIVVDPAVFSNYTTDDFFYEFEKELKWKIFEVEKKRQVGSLTQIALQASLIQDYETGYMKVPI
mgnify:CR=1 FL=1